MEQNKLSALRNVRNLGTVSLIVGSLWVVNFVVYVALLMSEVGLEILVTIWASEYLIYGIFFILVALIFLILPILYIIAGIKLRKPISKPKGWIITLVVLGSITALTLMGILTLVFGIIALNSYKDIEGDQSTPPEIPNAK